MKKDDKVYLMHIRDYIQRIENSFKNATKEEYETDVDLQDVAHRRIEIIGEATKNISAEFKKKHSEIPWKDIAGMRDVLAHAYFMINGEEVFRVIQNDLPKLKKQIIELLEELNKKMEKGE